MHKDIFDVLTTNYKPGFTIYLSHTVKRDDDYVITYPDGEIFMLIPAEDTERIEANIVHESAHAMFHMLFLNNCKPFATNNYEMQQRYYQAERSTLKKIAAKLGLIDEENDLSSYLNKEIIELIKGKSLIALMPIKMMYNDMKNGKFPDMAVKQKEMNALIKNLVTFLTKSYLTFLKCLNMSNIRNYLR